MEDELETLVAPIMRVVVSVTCHLICREGDILASVLSRETSAGAYLGSECSNHCTIKLKKSKQN